MLPWKQFITKIHDDNKIAAQFYIECVSKTVLLAWKQHYESKCEQRNNKADQFYVAMVTKRSLRVWKKVGHFAFVVNGCHGYDHLVCTRYEVHK